MAEENAPVAPVFDNSIEGSLARIAQGESAAAPPTETDTPAEAPAPVAETTDNSEVPAAPAPTAITPPATPPATPEAKPETPPADWREAIKNVDVAELLQLKGVDEKVAKLFNKYANDGDLSDYFKAYSVDYDKLPDEAMLRVKIEQKYADFSPEDKEEMYQAELERYHLDAASFDEKEVRRAKIALKADVAETRAAMKAKQAESLVPSRDLRAEQAAAKAREEQVLSDYADSVRGSEAYQQVAATKTIKVGEGDKAFNMDVDPEYVLKYLTDENVYASTFMGADGKPDYQKQAQVAAFARDPKAFMDKAFDHLLKVSKKSFIQELGHETPPERNGIPAGASDLSPAAQLLNTGQIRFNN